MQICTSAQTENHASIPPLSSLQPFLPPNQQRQSNEGIKDKSSTESSDYVPSANINSSVNLSYTKVNISCKLSQWVSGQRLAAKSTWSSIKPVNCHFLFLCILTIQKREKNRSWLMKEDNDHQQGRGNITNFKMVGISLWVYSPNPTLP